MKAIRIHRNGGPEVLQLDEVDTPTPAAGQALLKMEAIGVNFIDVYNRAGLYPAKLPLTLGTEGAGVIEQVGPGVTDFKPGDRVAFAMQGGAYATHAVVSAAKLVSVPKDVGTDLAAAVMLQGMTAHYLSHSTFALKAGQTCLIHAGAGGVGLLLIQLAKQLGARVLTTVGTPEKAALAKEAGADEAILYTQTDFAAEVKRLTGGKGVDVVYDSVGLTTFEKGLTVLKSRGTMALFGQSSGVVPPFELRQLASLGSLFVTRPTLVNYQETREELLWRSGDVFRWIAEGKLKVRIGNRYPLAEVARAHQDLEGRKTTGKLILTP